MRIERLDILRYGTLTGKSFVFRPGAKLHLVYGPNEAGKSSVLAALGDLLFGFGKSKAYDFLHDAATLRVAARVQRSDGISLSFRRRRGNKNTLLSDADVETPLHDDALAPFLGTLTRETFERAFGLDSHRLREGAAEMLVAGGDAAGALFAAASGLTGLTQLRTALDEEAGTLYAPRASKDRRFYQILDRHEAARKSERETELRANDWKTLLEDIERHEAELADLGRRKLDLRSNVSRLQRLRQLQPILKEVDDELAQLAGFDDLGDTTPGLAQGLDMALAADTAARRAVVEAEAQRQGADEAMAQIVVDEVLLAASAEITALFARSGNDAKTRVDLPRVQAEYDAFIRQIGELSQRLGAADAENVPERQPSDAMLAELRALIEDGRAVTGRVRDLIARVANEKDGLAALDQSNDQTTLIDTRIWRERFEATRPDLAQLDRLQEMRTRLHGQLRRLTEQTGRLVPAVGDLTRLAGMSLPVPETLVRHRQALQNAANNIQSLRDRLGAAIAELGELDAAIAADEAGLPIPSHAAIAEARAARNAAFVVLKDGLEAGKAPPADAIGAFESLTAAADRLADMALAEGARVSRHSGNLRRRSDGERQRVEIEAAIATAEDAHGTALGAYRQLFVTAEVEPLSPDEMIAWVQGVASTLEERQSALALQDEIATIEAMGEALRPALAEIALGIGTAPGDALPVSAFARAIADRLSQLAETWAESRAIAGKREDGQRRIAKMEAELAAARAASEAWSARFAAAVAGIGLDGTTMIDGANAALAVWEKLPGVLSDRNSWARRIHGMQRDIEAFEHEVRDLAVRVAPDLVGRAAGEIIALLTQRAQAAQAAAAQRTNILTQIDALDARLAAARRDGQGAEERLAALTRGLPEGTDLPGLIVRLRERESLVTNLGKSRQRLRDAAEGMDEAQMRIDLMGFDRDAAAAELAALEEAAGRLDEDANQHYALLRDATRRREALEAGGGVELAVYYKNAAEAEIVDVARQWVVLKLAAALLGAAMDKQREANANPLLDRAGTLLATLTGGSLTRLVEDYDEDDHPRLTGVRPTGERLGVEAMSEGTRDQLYLALRLAYLEDYARNNEPAPFIGDDIFQTFDDDRTIAGLKALAETSASFQPILFTHHRSVVDAGIKALGKDLDLIEW